MTDTAMKAWVSAFAVKVGLRTRLASVKRSQRRKRGSDRIYVVEAETHVTTYQ
jgi:hypothetical protein